MKRTPAIITATLVLGAITSSTNAGAQEQPFN